MSLVDIRTFFGLFFSLEIAENGFWPKFSTQNFWTKRAVFFLRILQQTSLKNFDFANRQHDLTEVKYFKTKFFTLYRYSPPPSLMFLRLPLECGYNGRATPFMATPFIHEHNPNILWFVTNITSSQLFEEKGRTMFIIRNNRS